MVEKILLGHGIQLCPECKCLNFSRSLLGRCAAIRITHMHPDLSPCRIEPLQGASCPLLFLYRLDTC
jgi:hypothetical protein